MYRVKSLCEKNGRGGRKASGRVVAMQKFADIKILLEWKTCQTKPVRTFKNCSRNVLANWMARIREMRRFSKSLKRLLSACEESCDARCALLEDLRTQASGARRS